METRFGFKDFVLVTLIILLVLVIFLGMKQLDRQWVVLQQMRDQGNQQLATLASIQRTLENGIVTRNASNGSAPTSGPTAAHDDSYNAAFANILEAEKKDGFARGDWLIDNFATKLPKVTPLISSDLYSQWVQAKVLDGLIYRDPDTLEYLPQLARSWQISPDGMTFTFQLRKGVRFSDGHPLTADDVVYSYDIIMNPKINAPRQRAYYEKVKSVTRTSEEEVVFQMKEPYFEALDLCGTISVMPKHFYSQFSEEEINQNPGLLMGSGPYKMPDPKGWRPGEKLQLVRNENYWGVPPTFDRLVYLEVEEEAAEETMFGNGELDVFAPAAAEQYVRLLKDPKVTARANHFEYESPMLGYAYIAWNESRDGKPTRFADKLVRRAMTQLIDRERICKEVFLGYAKPISGPFSAGSPQADPSIKPWAFDVEAARKLLKEAGYDDRDGSGVLKDKDGHPFRFKLTYGSGNATFERVVFFLKDAFAAAGVTMEPDPVEWSILIKKLDERNFDAITLSWGGSVESDLYQEFDSSQIADQGDNFMSYKNPQLDETVRAARATVDTKKRMDIWHKAHAILHEDQPYTFLLSRMSTRFMDNRIQNVRKSKIGLNYVYVYTMPIPWYVPRGQQKYR
jgi:peptide/nickel transport system substrate-binding protein